MHFHISDKKVKYILTGIIILLLLPLTIVILHQQQQIKQYAEVNTLHSPPPPLFGCLAVGESNKNACASISVDMHLTAKVHNLNVMGKTVYYGDTLTAQTTVKNVGDKTLHMKNLGAVAATMDHSYATDLQPNQLVKDLLVNATATSHTSSHTFNAPDPGGQWYVTSKISNSANQSVEDLNQVRFTVSTKCTALRGQPLSQRDIKNLDKICHGKPSTPLCKEYCEIMPAKCGMVDASPSVSPNPPSSPSGIPSGFPSDPPSPTVSAVPSGVQSASIHSVKGAIYR